jgi:hypothetical protein
MKRMRMFRIASVSLSLLVVGMSEADNGKYRNSSHGSPTTGVFRVSDHPRGSCAQCHVSHDVLSSRPYGLFDENSNRLCFSASLGGCHADKPTGGTAGYPAQEADRLPAGSSDPGYFEYNAGGTRVAGVQNRVRWPGQLIWENAQFSPHYASPAMPIKDAQGNGSCDNCHNVHGGSGTHDLTDTTWQGIVGSQTGSLPSNYQQCLGCHSPFGPAGMDDTSRMIWNYYDQSINGSGVPGHSGLSGGYVPSGARMPCYDCHNPHGSVGNGGAGGNKYLLSDQRPGWYGLTNIKYDNTQVRRFCFGCHRSSDGFGGGTVEGIVVPSLPNKAAHAYNDTKHCYDCHGRDYSSATGNNVHNPRH